MTPSAPSIDARRAYLVGGGIANLASAVYLIRDGAMPAANITIFEAAGVTGGSLDGHGSPGDGYVIRGGRMFNFSYRNTYELLDSIPSLDDEGQSVRDEIVAFNERYKTHAQARILANGRPIDVSSMGFRNKDRLALVEMVLRRESAFDGKCIDEQFEAPIRLGGLAHRDVAAHSKWLLSLVLARQPHFRGQPEDVQVFWGYGLYPNERGDFVKKTLTDCNGSEILTELLSHLRFTDLLPDMLQTATCIPCIMPYITSQFLPRSSGDRPLVVPKESRNLAFVGQFCELPEDTVFTVEYSVRAARTAVYQLLGIQRHIPPIYHGQYDPRVLVEAIKTSFA